MPLLKRGLYPQATTAGLLLALCCQNYATWVMSQKLFHDNIAEQNFALDFSQKATCLG